MKIPAEDREILRRLGEEIGAFARFSANAEKAEMWRKLNDLEPVRPLVYIDEIPWHELNVNDELTLGCSMPLARVVEEGMRKKIYRWKHFPADMVVDDFFESPLAIRNSGLGIHEDVDVVKTDENNPIVSRHFNAQIKEPEDIALIQDPVVTLDEEKTEERYEFMNQVFGDIMPIRKTGVKHFWFTPWDDLIRLWGIQEAMMDLVLRPEMVNAFVSRFVEASMGMLDQYEEKNLLSLGFNNRVGSGGMGFTGELPGQTYNPDRVKPHNMWGCSNAQIFSGVSPEMHWEFAVKHDIPWLQRWGMNYYGCCEPLHLKMDIMRKIPNLRKISMSPPVDLHRAAEEIGREYVISRKPNPAILAEKNWRPEQARKEIREALEITKGLNVELILKDISTVKYQPERLWEWESIAMDEVSRFFP